MVAVMNGYEGELVDWLSLVSRDFWFGRNRNMYQEYAGYTPPGKDHEGEVKYTGSLNLKSHICQCVNSSEITKRHFNAQRIIRTLR